MLDSVAHSHCPKGHDIMTHPRSIRVISHASPHYQHFSRVPYSCDKLVHVPSLSMCHRIQRCSFITANIPEGTPLLTSAFLGGGKLRFSNHRHTQRGRFCVYASIDVASAVDVINDLGMDTLTFLAVTVLIVPAFKFIKASPILGFFFAGVVLNQFGLIRNITDVKVLSEWGILFLVGTVLALWLRRVAYLLLLLLFLFGMA